MENHNEEYQEYSQEFENGVTNVRLRDQSVVKLLEITWTPCDTNGHQLQLAMVEKYDGSKLPIRQISVDEIAHPTPFLITDRTREIINNDGGDLESVEGDANFLCIYG
jgi:hypothetical protein